MSNIWIRANDNEDNIDLTYDRYLWSELRLVKRLMLPQSNKAAQIAVTKFSVQMTEEEFINKVHDIANFIHGEGDAGNIAARHLFSALRKRRETILQSSNNSGKAND